MDGRSFGSARVRGPWNVAEIEAFLRAAVIPIRLAATTPSGWPVVLSLWFLAEPGALLCATRRDAGIVQALEHDARCAFEVAGEQPPYRGVRGRGRVVLQREGAAAVLEALIERYLGSTSGSLASWLLRRADDEVVIRIEPSQLASWDYTRRMSAP